MDVVITFTMSRPSVHEGLEMLRDGPKFVDKKNDLNRGGRTEDVVRKEELKILEPEGVERNVERL